MTEIYRIVDQMDRAFGGDAWHGPSLESLLDGITAEQASQHPVAGAHSIWELVNHIASWNSIVQHERGGLETLARAFARVPCPLARRRTKVAGA